MALKHVRRSRVPLDGRWFRTTARLQSILRAAARYDDEMNWPSCVSETWVPVWVSMVECHDAQQTRQNASGLIYRPTVRIGDMNSPEVKLGDGYAAGLDKDSHLDGWDNDHKWIYRVFENDSPLGEDASLYLCDQCGHGIYRDDLGRRHDRSACIYDGGLVCRDCECLGLIVPGDSADRLENCRKLASFVGRKCRDGLERNLEVISRKESWGHPSQTRLMLDGQWSFFWSERVRIDNEWKKGMVGGLIQHGPTPLLGDDGAFAFTTYDYGTKVVRPATEKEIASVCWSLHT